jgi:DNA-binding NarL/FixJ family response regulator
MDVRCLDILIVDDHPAVRDGLRGRINQETDMRVCGEAANVESALQLAEVHQPDVVIVDISLKTEDGLALIKQLVARGSRARLLVHSMHDETIYADRCLRAGAAGYLSKEEDPSEVIQAIRTVVGGQVSLSPRMSQELRSRGVDRASDLGEDPIATLTNRELEVFRHIGHGLTAQQIADRLGISVHTVESHRENIKRKLSIRSIPELSRRAVQWVLTH